MCCICHTSLTWSVKGGGQSTQIERIFTGILEDHENSGLLAAVLLGERLGQHTGCSPTAATHWLQSYILYTPRGTALVGELLQPYILYTPQGLGPQVRVCTLQCVCVCMCVCSCMCLSRVPGPHLHSLTSFTH
jgi:hypothetical protein